MQFSTTQKPFVGRKSTLFVEGSRAWIPLKDKLAPGRAVSAPVVHTKLPGRAVDTTPAGPAVAAQTSAPPPAAAPARPSSTPRATARPAQPAPPAPEAGSHDCSDLIACARRSFKNIAGMADTKRRLLRAGRDVLAGGNPRNGILLFGEPGNGKTLFAEALAGELGVPFLSVAFGDMASKWLNETPEKLRGLFRTARRCAPCVLLIDEIDSFLKPRDGSSMTHSMDRDIVNTMLKEIVALRDAPVVLVAATNYVEQLDRAAIRAGRFDFHIEIPCPDFYARRCLIWGSLASAFGREEANDQQRLVETLARRWEGFSAARLAALGAQLREMRRDGEVVGPITAELAMRAMRLVQGQRSTLPEHVLALESIVMPTASRGVLEDLAGRLRNAYDFMQWGGTLPRGILFYGPPGTGKTMAAMALAKETGWQFLATTGTDLITRADTWEKLVRTARDQRPAIVFIDEADTVLMDRRHSNAAALTNRILASIDGTSGRVPDVVYIAATNHADVLDAAVLRGGRFAMRVRFDLPDAGALLAYVEHAFTSKCEAAGIDWCDGVPVAAARLLTGRPIADAEALVAEAVNVSAMRFLDGFDDVPRLLVTEVHTAARSLGFETVETD
jgi:transitional endoplasmic reticulum ATPase